MIPPSSTLEIKQRQSWGFDSYSREHWEYLIPITSESVQEIKDKNAEWEEHLGENSYLNNDLTEVERQ